MTANTVMFDPYVSDPLVIEQGADLYGVIAPMNLILQMAIYDDIAAMRYNRLAITSTLIYFSCQFPLSIPTVSRGHDRYFLQCHNMAGYVLTKLVYNLNLWFASEACGLIEMLSSEIGKQASHQLIFYLFIYLLLVFT